MRARLSPCGSVVLVSACMHFVEHDWVCHMHLELGS